MPSLFIIAGCNGAGKTTASFTILPELLKVKEFVNADEIARGLSPFQPETVAIEAGKIMLRRIDELIASRQDFAFETTLSTRSFVNLCHEAQFVGYSVNLIFFWLDSFELALERVKQRVSEGGHNIPPEIIKRRYSSGLRNLVNLYQNEVDYWLLIDNSRTEQELIAEGKKQSKVTIHNEFKWAQIDDYIRNKE